MIEWKYDINQDDWLHMVDLMNRFADVKAIVKNAAPGSLVSRYYVAQLIGWEEAAGFLRKAILSKMILSPAELKRYDDRFSQTKVPDYVQDVIDDLCENDLKGGVAVGLDEDSITSTIPTVLKRYLTKRPDVITYERIPSYRQYELIKVDMVQGVYYILFVKSPSNYYLAQVMPEADYKHNKPQYVTDSDYLSNMQQLISFIDCNLPENKH